jgi:seryl-tRNA synthetase
MALFGGRASMLEVQNQALIKTAKERAQRIEELECELQILRARAEQANNKVERELQQARSERERLTLERDFYSKRALALEQHNREVTEAATKYSLWGQSLERELVKIDPDGARARQFGAWSASQVSALEPPLRGAA